MGFIWLPTGGRCSPLFSLMKHSGTAFRVDGCFHFSCPPTRSGIVGSGGGCVLCHLRSGWRVSQSSGTLYVPTSCTGTHEVKPRMPASSFLFQASPASRVLHGPSLAPWSSTPSNCELLPLLKLRPSALHSHQAAVSPPRVSLLTDRLSRGLPEPSDLPVSLLLT